MKKSLLLTLLSIFVNVKPVEQDRTLMGLVAASSQKRKADDEPLEKPENPKARKTDGQAASSTDHQEIAQCTICYENLEDGIVTLPFTGEKKKDCGHKYHKFCLRTWLQNNKNCPACRANVTLKIPYSLLELMDEQYAPPITSPFATYSVRLTRKSIDSLEGFEKQPKDKATTLTLANNLIPNIPVGFLAHFSGLTYLSFYNNKIRKLVPGMFKDASSLQTLILSFNGIKALPAGAFKGTKISKLSFYGNCIKHIDNDAFSKDDTEDRLPLKCLNFSDNNMHSFNATALKGVQLKDLQLLRNHLPPQERLTIGENLPQDCRIAYEN